MPRSPALLLLAAIVGCAPIDEAPRTADASEAAREGSPGVGPRALPAPIDPLRPLLRKGSVHRRITGGQEGEPVVSNPPADGATDPDDDAASPPSGEESGDTSDTGDDASGG